MLKGKNFSFNSMHFNRLQAHSAGNKEGTDPPQDGKKDLGHHLLPPSRPPRVVAMKRRA